MSLNSFSEAVYRKLGYYVYRLADPRNGETFYVGKGVGNRVFSHVACSLENGDGEEDSLSLKYKRIKEIRSAGLETIHIIHRHNIPESAVYEVEAALIDAYPGLSNAQGGHHSADRGPMNAAEIVARYALPSVPDNTGHKLILININHFDESDRLTLLDQVRFAWRLSLKRARQADYVLAVIRGVVVGAFVAREWLPANDSKLGIPLASNADQRFGFNGEKAPQEIWGLYVGQHGKRLDNESMRHVQNPIRYYNIDDQ